MKLDPKNNAWLSAPQTRAVMQALGEHDARFVGGAVRNAVLGLDVADIDIATRLRPETVMERLQRANIKALATGIEHGTVTAISGDRLFEITTLRRDVKTDGRHAVVAFGADWAEDARRRDFTMNALYASLTGEVFDDVGGVEDARAGRVRFVGDPATRIREDYLRILRLFRFHAWYGRGEIDGRALAAAAAEKAELRGLSAERVQKELLRLLAAPDPMPALRAMAASGVLAETLPGVSSLARLERLGRIDSDNFFAPDPVLRLAALLSDVEAARAIAERLRLSNAQGERLAGALEAGEKIVSYLSIREVRKLLYRMGPQRFRDRVLLKWAEDARPANAVQWRALVALADGWERPRFPLTGENVIAAGVPQGPLVGRILAEVEAWWVDSDFPDDPFSLAERLKAVVQAMAY
ncbi:MAG TPA: CCA tRNA nucleotidyltransferase [Rhizomicrobium sp.]|jgi:poly(A) polymerase|nr:CCA tRNA nucleotidyltransferase [Rhizomicrobium sp.]